MLPSPLFFSLGVFRTQFFARSAPHECIIPPRAPRPRLRRCEMRIESVKRPRFSRGRILEIASSWYLGGKSSPDQTKYPRSHLFANFDSGGVMTDPTVGVNPSLAALSRRPLRSFILLCQIVAVARARCLLPQSSRRWRNRLGGPSVGTQRKH